MIGEKKLKINKIKINAFGKIKNKEINLENKINLIQGKNEAGKSTLIKFILNSFYGISKNKKGKEYSDFEKYTPWLGEEFSGKIEYELDNKEKYEIFRDFNKNIGGYSYDKNGVTLGGNRNYLRRDLKQGGKYVLNLRTTTSNKGLMGNYGFGIGYAASINFDQPLEITGHRIMEKQYNANKGRGTDQYGSSVKDDLSLVPVISGRTGQKIQGFSQADQQWLDRNAY